MSAMPLMIVVLCCLAIAFRYYSAFLAAKVAALDDARVTPAHTLNDGQNYHPTHKWVLFGHHFAAISGAGPLIGPVLAIQYGFLPGLIWIVIGVCLAGAVQDMLVLAASVRRNGRSLAEIARAEISPLAGATASLAILFVVIVALSGLGVVVVKALGGEEVRIADGTTISIHDEVPATEKMKPRPTPLERKESPQTEFETVDGRDLIHVPPNSTIHYPGGKSELRSEGFTLRLPPKDASHSVRMIGNGEEMTIGLPEGTTQIVPGGSDEIQLDAGASVSIPEEVRLGSLDAMQPPAAERRELPRKWLETVDGRELIHVPPNSTMYSMGHSVHRSEGFTLRLPPQAGPNAVDATSTPDGLNLRLLDGTTQLVPGSSWGTFTIACTIPIALFVGLYMYKIRKGRVVEASLIGAAGVLAATAIGASIPGSQWASFFSLSRGATIWAICGYGFIASVLPVWMLLCPRDYLSSFLKIGTVALLVGAVIVANPKLEAPQVNQVFAAGGPTFPGAIFPFCFICIMCGAVSGFHALVSSGTTPKMISKESQIRTIGYGAMLIEGLVAIVALIAAASLPSSDYYAINVPLDKAAQFADKVALIDSRPDNLATIEQAIGNESLRGREGGAVTLAVGMSKIINDATQKIAGRDAEGIIKYWYHFALMFEALFILTTIDTGTRIARFLLQEFLGKFHPQFDRTDWLPGAVLSTGLVTAAWGGLIATGSIGTIWPMFGIANQLLAVIALSVVTTVMVNAGRAKYVWVTLPAILFVVASTTTAGYQMVTGRFWDRFRDGWKNNNFGDMLTGGLNMALVLFMIGATGIILLEAVNRCLSGRRTGGASASKPAVIG